MELNQGRQERADLEEQLKAVAVGGVGLELFGVFLFFIGIMLTTIPAELTPIFMSMGLLR